MGKSPGKWFKAVLFGKKASKSNLSKGKEIKVSEHEHQKSAIEKATLVPNKEPASNLPVDPPVVSEPLPCFIAGSIENTDTEKGGCTRLPTVGLILASPKQDREAQTATDFGLAEDSERMRLEQAATKAQAAFRGFLARRSFQTLKGIVRVQAVIRGHLVRRQAVATLYCVKGIIKFQAFVRGHRVRCSGIGTEVHSKLTQVKQDAKQLESCEKNTYAQAEKLLKNAFVARLLSLSPNTMPLHLQYGPEEPNSAWGWLVRWTVSHVWELQSDPKKVNVLNSQKIETGKARAKRNGRRLQSGNIEIGSNHLEKQKQKPRRVSDHSADSVQGHPQNEIEKVKRNLKKVSPSLRDSTGGLVADTEQPSRNHSKSLNILAPEHFKHNCDSTSDKLRIDMEGTVSKPKDEGKCAEIAATDSPFDGLHDHPISDSEKQLKDDGTDKKKSEDIVTVDKDEQTGNENHKIIKRRASLPAKHDDIETGLPSTTKVPSYMATTESAKAKAREQVSQRFEQDAYEKNSLTRRHSLPSSTNSKLSSSPRVQRLVQASGKGGIKVDRSLSSSRDDRTIQAEWRR